MRVTLVAADEGPCSQYRLLWPGQAVANTHGVQTKVVRELPHFGHDRHETSTATPETDVIVVQRPMWRLVVDEIPELQRRGIAVAVDLDDDFLALHPDHRAHGQLDEDTTGSYLVQACVAADVVTGPAPALLDRYAPHGRGALIRNYLPEWALDVPDRRHGNTIGWSGVAADHPGDLEDTGGAVAAVLRAHGARFHVVGPPDGVAERLGLDRPASGTGMLSIHDYFQALGSIDVGIVPLEPSRFNTAKSCLKGLEWAAAGVPFVASPTPEYEWLADQGIGRIARTPQEWEERLSELLGDEALRHEFASSARRLVAERFLLPGNAWRWVDAWSQARANRQARARVERGAGPQGRAAVDLTAPR
jgi:glycosyltransferase involved in cell wall biosynthesis